MCAMYDNMAGVWVCTSMNLLCVCSKREKRERKENHDVLKKREHFSKLVVEIGKKNKILF